MSKPSFSNIDLWLFELAEGNLTPEQIEQLELFLLEHPELDLERDAWELAKVDATPVAYPGVEKMQRKRRVAGMYLFSTALVLLLLFFGGYSYFNYQQLKPQGHLSAEELELKEKERILIERINELNDHFTSNGIAEKYGQFNSDKSSDHEIVNEDSSPILASEQVVTSSNERRKHQASLVADRTQIGQELTGNTEPSIAQSRVLEAFTTTPAREVDLAIDHSFVRSSNSRDRQSFGSSSMHNSSMKSRLKKFGRSIQRMMDNPVALKNSRDPNYHIPGMTANDVNFSSAGTLLATRFQTLSRMQWLGEENEQLMNQISIDGYSYEARGGWALQLNHAYYKNGGLQQSQAAFTYSPKFSVSNSISVEPSLRFKMGNKHLNADQLSEATSIEMDRGNNILFSENGATPLGKNLWYKDLGAGLLVNTQWFFAGIQMDNLFRYTDNIYSKDLQDPRRASHAFVATVGTDWVNQRKTLGLSPYAVYQHNDQLSELWVGANVRWNWLQVGIAATDKLEPAGSVGVKFEHFSMSYHADYTTSAMTNKQSLSHQLTLRIVGNQNRFNR